MLLVAVYWRANLTMRQIGPLFGVSHSAAHRVVDSLGPLLVPVDGYVVAVDHRASNWERSDRQGQTTPENESGTSSQRNIARRADSMDSCARRVATSLLQGVAHWRMALFGHSSLMAGRELFSVVEIVSGQPGMMDN